MSENEPVQMIEGRYRIVRNIAEGGMATVYEAVDERLGRTCLLYTSRSRRTKRHYRPVESVIGESFGDLIPVE